MAEVAVEIVRAFVAAGVDHAFTVPGESFLPILDALRDEPRIRTIAMRHEGGAAFAAEAYAKVTRRPTLAMGTRAVGAANLSIGLHTADQDSSPVVAVIGQVRSSDKGREAFQEVDIERFLGAVTRWAVEPDTTADLPSVSYAACRRALSGRQGPTAMAYREDLLHGEVPPIAFPSRAEELSVAGGLKAAGVLARLRAALRPVLLVGHDVVVSGAVDDLIALAEREHVPVVAIWRRPDAFPNDHPLYVGMAGLGVLPSVISTLRDADHWLVVGDRLDENTCAGYSLPSADQSVDHVWLDGPGLSGQGGGESIESDAKSFVTQALSIYGGPNDPDTRLAYIAGLRERWERESTPIPMVVADGCVDQYSLVAEVRRLLPAGSVFVSDAGNFSSWPARYLRWNEPGTFVGPVSGAMGYAVPAALGAALARPDRQVVAYVGDGGFLMTAAELQTAAREGISFTIVLVDNGRYNTIRMHQERAYPGRPIATDLGETDYVGLSRALGASAELVTDISEFESAFTAALATTGPSVVVVRADPEQLSVAQGDRR